MPLNQDDNVDQITVRHYCALRLKVPDSGEPWLDEMIRKSRRVSFEEKLRVAWPGWPDTAVAKAIKELYPEGFKL